MSNVALIPTVQYVKNGDFTLAYQVTGHGAKDLVYLPTETPNVVGNWFVPEHARFIERLASFARIVISDRRGMGCSDRLSPGHAPALEDHVDDLLLVMQAAYATPVTVFAAAETSFIAMLAAATHPDRFEGLILWAASPSWIRSDELPWEDPPDKVEAHLGAIRGITNLHTWAERFTRVAVPSWADDAEKLAMMEALSAIAGSGEAWYQDQQLFHGLDLRDLLPSIRVPTLVMTRRELRLYPLESSEFLAERLPEARLVVLEGSDVFPWIGDADSVLAEVEEFLTGRRAVPDATRSLSTVLFTDLVDSTGHAARLGDAAWRRLLAEHHAAVREVLTRWEGVEVDTAGDGFFATFDGPARAVRCVVEIVRNVADLGIEVRAGVHTGEVERSDKQVQGIAVHVGARVAAIAKPSEVLVTSTVRDLVAGSGLAFEEAGEHELKGVPDRWRLYRVVG
jgi:class 3 adenylate cyclase